MMGQPVEQCARETFCAEGFRPFGSAPGRGVNCSPAGC